MRATAGGALSQMLRQQVIGNHIIEFVAKAQRLVVEVDGDAYHAHRIAADAARERKLLRAGYTILRLPASLVEKNLRGAVAAADRKYSH